MTDLRSYELTKRENTLFYIALVASGIVLSLLMYRNIIFAVVILPFGKKIKSFIVEAIIEKRRQNYLVQFKDFLFMASTSIGAGRSMKDSIGEAIPGIKDIYGENAILACELDKVHERIAIGGENDIDVLMEMAVSSGIEDCVDFVTIYSICKATGASLILALNKAASVIIEKMTIDKEIRELVKRKESEGLIIFVMPVVVILFLNLCAPDYIAPLYETIVGRIIMTSVIAANVGIFGMIQKITNVQV
ncbi:MAG: hypothetical protein KBS56_00775 [Clostridiales bacterium]|nr:hypothetical protein [Candidatus Crickella equi]